MAHHSAHHSYPVGAAPVTVVNSRTFDAWNNESERLISRAAHIGYSVHTMSLTGMGNGEILDLVRDLKTANDLLQHVIALLHIDKEGGSDGDR